MTKVIFLDRDGTISEEIGYYSDFSKFKPIKGTIDGLKKLRDKGYDLIVVTNQSGIARGLFTEKNFLDFTSLMKSFFLKYDIEFKDVLYCPHHPEYGDRIICECRKPNTLLIEQATEKYNIDLTKSYFVGDNVGDMTAAKRSGVKSVLVLTGFGEETSKKLNQYKIMPNFIVKDLQEASHVIN